MVNDAGDGDDDVRTLLLSPPECVGLVLPSLPADPPLSLPIRAGYYIGHIFSSVEAGQTWTNKPHTGVEVQTQSTQFRPH